MIINEQMKVSGTIEGDEDLVVRGRVEGIVRIGGTLTVEPGGFLAAEVHARSAAIYGTVLGNVTAGESIEVARSGQMVGDATAPRISIVPGAAFRGRLEMGEITALPARAEATPLLPSLAARRPLAPPALPAPEEAPPPPARSAAERRNLPRPAAQPREVPRLVPPPRGPLRRRPDR